MRRLSDDCHAYGTAVMIQLTHLGRRTAWNKADWLPVVAPSPVREPAHRAFPKVIEDWDIDARELEAQETAARAKDAKGFMERAIDMRNVADAEGNRIGVG